MKPPPSKVVVLGIDAASPALLKQWAADGTMPNIRSVMQRGLVADTLSVEGFFIGSTWPSLYTGTTPARHGLHYLVQLVPGTYRLERPADGRLIDGEPFWTAISRAGHRVAVLDVPLTRADTSLNGIQVVEWGGHDALYGFHAWPADLERTIRASFGDYPPGSSCDADRRSAVDYRTFADSLISGVRAKARLTRHFLAQGNWDLFVQVFTEAHCAGHQCWHLHDTRHPAHDLATVAVTGDPLRRVYAAIDTAIGEVLEDAGDALVVIVAAHGMSHWYGAHFLLRDILFRLGAARPAPEPAPPPASLRSAAIAGARWTWRRLPPSLRAALSPLRQRLSRDTDPGERQQTIGVDEDASRCFVLDNGLAVGGIRLNLAGREPRGVLHPGADADAFCDWLSRELLAIVDERTGTPLVRRVLRTADLYQGPHLDRLPDLLVDWSDEVPSGSTELAGGIGATVRVRSSAVGVVEGANDFGRSGEHRRGGLLVVAGPGVRAGQLNRVISILDIAPTLAAALGVHLPNCDGHPLPELADVRC
ncbi:MAG TPA: alkaline phosphatase family protein [Gemmatimonadaceae bacterium]|nr:alkaline phosphatase family protein [Gemmatimonadaceae bacterium]